MLNMYESSIFAKTERYIKALCGYKTIDAEQWSNFCQRVTTNKNNAYDLVLLMDDIMAKNYKDEEIRVQLSTLLYTDWKGDFVFDYDPNMIPSEEHMAYGLARCICNPIRSSTMLSELIRSVAHAMNDIAKDRVSDEFKHFAFISKYRYNLKHFSYEDLDILFNVIFPSFIVHTSSTVWSRALPFQGVPSMPELVTKHQYFRQLFDFYITGSQNKVSFILCDVWNRRIEITSALAVAGAVGLIAYGLSQLFPGTYEAQYSDIPKDKPGRNQMKGMKKLAAKARLS